MPLPHSTQQLLLQAACLSGAPGVLAFEEWQRAQPLDEITADDYPLLPLVYRNLERQQIDHSWLSRLAGVYKRTWYANQLALRPLPEILQMFEDTGIPSLLVGSAALGATVYPDPALRPIDTPEVVVPWERAEAAIALLLANGWQPRPAAPLLGHPSYREWVAGWRFDRKPGESVRLHWRVLAEWPTQKADEDCWKQTTSLQINEQTISTLAPTQQLLRVCASLTQQPLIGLVDAARLMETTAIDWPHLLQMATDYRMTHLLRQTLERLAACLPVEIPPGILAEMPKQTESSFGHPTLFSQPAFAHRLPIHRLTHHWHRFRRIAQAHARRATPATFVAYLQHQYGFSHPWQLIAYGMGRVTQTPQAR